MKPTLHCFKDNRALSSGMHIVEKPAMVVCLGNRCYGDFSTHLLIFFFTVAVVMSVTVVNTE